MSQDEDPFTELAPDYALGLLEADELDEFERHLAAGCAACDRELAAMDAVGDAMAYAPPPLRAPEALRRSLLAALESETAAAAPRPPEPAPSMQASPPPAPRPEPLLRPAAAVATASAPAKGSRLVPFIAILALVAAAGLGTMAWRLEGRLALLRADLERVQAERQAIVRVLDVVRATPLRLVPLAGLESAPTAHGRVLWSPEERKAVLHTFGLPRPPAGRDYQLWVIEGEAWRSEGVFPVDAEGRAAHVLPEMPVADGVTAFAVTIEPAGGVSRPKGETILMGTVPAAAP
jgi:anti-sigma-K factor RskA